MRRGISTLLLLVMWACSTCILAQDIRGSITGIITDPAGAVLPNAKVRVTNVETGVATDAVSNGAGNFIVPYLAPGTYRLEVETAGFSKWQRDGIELRVGDQLKINAELRVGSVSDHVVVEATAPLLETARADTGQIIASKELTELPVPDANPFLLGRLAAGTVYNGNPSTGRAFDAGGSSNFVSNGSTTGNTFAINGISDNTYPINGTTQTVAYVPPVDALKEVKISTAWFSASQGNASGSYLNAETKSGTNNLHGSLFEYFQNEALSATGWLVNHNNQRKPTFRSNHFGGTFGGPVDLPRVYDGRNKTFFFVMVEGLKDMQPGPSTRYVPTAKMRAGDLSELCIEGFDANGVCKNLNHQMYNPFSAVATSGGHVSRTPIPFNNLSKANLSISPVAQKYLSYYPLPNMAGATPDAPNYYSPDVSKNDYYSWIARVDHVISPNQRLSANYVQSMRAISGSWYPIPEGLTQGYQREGTQAVGITDTITLSPSTLLDIRLGFTRYIQDYEPKIKDYDLAALGLSPSVVSLAQGHKYLPRFSVTNLDNIASDAGYNNSTNSFSLVPALTKSMSGHILSIGYDLRNRRIFNDSPGYVIGTYTFGPNYAAATDSGGTQFGMGIVDFLVGQPTSGSITRTVGTALQGWYHAAFLQDDWNVTHKLTVNLGLRWEYELAPTDRFNRNTRGFDLATASPAQAAAQAAFKSGYPNGYTVATGLPSLTGITAVGGYTWADSNNRGFYNASPRIFLPRVGAAYSLNDRTVIRGGWALYYSPFANRMGGAPGLNQTGFSQATPFTATNDNGLTFLANINNPFPNGLMAAAGSSRGLYQNLGASATVFPTEVKNSYAQRWSVSLQRALPGAWVVEAAYVGNHSYNRDLSINIDAVPAAYWSTTQTRDQALITARTNKINNPFKGLFGSTADNSTSLNTASTVAVEQFLRPYSQFTSITQTVFNGWSDYESAQLTATHRFKKGYSVSANYTWSKLLEASAFNADFETTPRKMLGTTDVPHRLAATFIGEVPFGRGRRWGSAIPGWLNGVVGGWQFQGVYQIQSGTVLDFGNVYYSGDPSKLHFNYDSKLIGTTTPMLDVSGFYLPTDANGNTWTSDSAKRADTRIQLADNVRYFPRNMSNTRAPRLNNIDLSLKKEFRLREGVQLQMRGDFLNAFNHPWFSAPNVSPTNALFGTLNGSQRNYPRTGQIMMRLTF